ncbi:hypothetical protein [Rhodanobacter sp. DHB23]|uniref:hypothetical protein n=1 Tax=Rhodanobacter sp. DHB23 TaxID=2775923 RepID=UPI0017800B7C|nr:hypothetical protein [Rhodanobacter sp. DHB23]MBD8873874.1 hypothetical protein [Rhodanobacter sp. DHB23]
MASLIDRVTRLEERRIQQDPMRVICVDEHADRSEAVKRYRQETDYRGIVVAMDEVDCGL